MIAVYFLLLTFLPPDLQDFHDAVHQLGSEKFAVREAASEKLKETLDDNVIPILREATRSKDIETKLRATHILYYHYYRKLSIGGKDLPWIQCLPKDYPDRKEIIRKYKPKIDYSYDYLETYFPEERTATWNLMLDLLEEGKDIEFCVKTLDKMRKNEKQWTDNGTQDRAFYSSPPEFDN